MSLFCRFLAFGHKPKYRKTKHFDLMMVPGVKVITVPPEGDVNVCNKFHGSPSKTHTRIRRLFSLQLNFTLIFSLVKQM